MDFVPNQTGNQNQWFLKSKKKEGKYKDYYIWAPCNPHRNIYPNNWVKLVFRISILLGHLSHSGDLSLWVGVRRRPSCVVRRALTSSTQELLGQS